MTTSILAVAIAGLVATGSLARSLWLGGRRDGKIDEILERLTNGQQDHESRIRWLEDRRPRRQW